MRRGRRLSASASLIPIPLALAALAAASTAACGPPPSRFLLDNARAHVTKLAGEIGSRPIGSDQNRRAREYLIDQLSLYGFSVRVQQTEAARPELGLTARVSNIIAIKQGASPDAVGLIAHYDSHPAAPGAADDALGVAVCLEAGRVLAARQRPNRTLMILLTDGEEIGLMGASALARDADVSNRLRVYLNVEAIGSGEPNVLFESGPGHDWVVRAWARNARWPRGSSYATEVYKRLPSDTDFTMVKRLGIPGLNFAAIGDGYAYHTARDTPERLSSTTIRRMGENVLALAETLDRMELARHSSGDPIFFDVGSRVGIVYSESTSRLIGLAAVVLGVAAWLRILRQSSKTLGWLRLIITAVWSAIGATFIMATLYATVWAVRATREFYHPWYAHPHRLLILLVVAGILAGRTLVRVGTRLPGVLQGSASPLAVWTIALPVWAIVSALAGKFVPAASYFWSIPLLSAGLLFVGAPLGRSRVVTLGSALVLAVTGLIWIREWWAFSLFLVAQMGRLPFVTPLFVYPALIATAGPMLIPPLMAAFTPRMSRAASSTSMTVALVASLILLAWITYHAPAYTTARPLRAEIRFVQQPGSVAWEIGSTEPWLDPGIIPGAPRHWRPSTAPRTSRPIGPLRQPFRLEASGSPEQFPGSISATLTPTGDRVDLRILLTAPPESTVSFQLPPGITPDRSSIPGRIWRSRWRADFAAAPPEGMSFEARLPGAVNLGDTFVIVQTPRLPGGRGWQSLPNWLPTDRVVWDSRAVFIESAGPHLEPAPPADRISGMAPAEPLR